MAGERDVGGHYENLGRHPPGLCMSAKSSRHQGCALIHPLNAPAGDQAHARLRQRRRVHPRERRVRSHFEKLLPRSCFSMIRIGCRPRDGSPCCNSHGRRGWIGSLGPIDGTDGQVLERGRERDVAGRGDACQGGPDRGRERAPPRRNGKPASPHACTVDAGIVPASVRFGHVHQPDAVVSRLLQTLTTAAPLLLQTRDGPPLALAHPSDVSASGGST